MKKKRYIILFSILMSGLGLSAQHSWSLSTGMSCTNFMGGQEAFRSYSEENHWGWVAGIRFQTKKGKFRNSLGLEYRGRNNKVETYGGGLAGGTTHQTK